MPSRRPSYTSASSAVPILYQALLLYAEPFCAGFGAALVFCKPDAYLSASTRRVVKAIDPDIGFIYTELAGGWLHFAFTEAIVLRLVDNLRVWKLLCIGKLLSDIAYCHSCAQAVGGWASWIQVWKWALQDWVITLTTWPFALARCAIVLDIALDRKEVRKAGSRKAEP